ncbi:MAG TPA: hypothetical protein VL588_06550, partial [Bdellovibrionota bacterium]|nr:hypothetical protein [Bdellovibrionota bacterium]
MGDPQVGPTKTLLPPDPYAEAAARAFVAQATRTRIVFSQNTGQILWIDGRGGALWPAGDCSTADTARALAVAFLQAHSGLLRIRDADADLSLAEPFLARDAIFIQDPQSGTRAVRLEQSINGFTSPDHYVIAHFGADCALNALVTTAQPTDASASQ